VIFARVNVDLNEIDHIYIDSFPHVKLYKSGIDHPITLYDENTYEGLISWLRVNSNYGEIFGHEDL
jgi:hypothetical protein